MGAGFSKRLFGERSSRVRNCSRQINQPTRNLRPKITGTIAKTGRKSSFRFNNNNNNFSQTPQQAGPETPQPQAGPAIPQPQAGPATPQPQAGPAIPQPQVGPPATPQPQAGPSAQQQPRTRSFFNKLLRRPINTNTSQLTQNNKNEIFLQLNKNITFILQRHATSCANIINKGFETGSTSYLTFGKTRLVAEIAPDSMLSSIGIDECNQVHDYLTNEGTEITKLQEFNYLFCCSELIRTQQTMFLSYFELIHSNGIKIMVLPWLNEEHYIAGMNKDNLTITLAETKKRWKKFIEILIEFPILKKLLNYLKSEISVNNKNKSAFIPGNKLSHEDIKEKDRLIEKVKFMYGEKIDISHTSISNKIKEETEKYNKYSNWDSVFYLPDFIYRTPPTGQDATFDKRDDLERLYKIKMKESGIKTKSYNANDLLFALPFILHLNNNKQKLQKNELKIFMTGHSHTMVQLLNFITLQTNNGSQTKYYSKPYLEKQQMMNAEIIALKEIQLSRLINISEFIRALGIDPNAIKGIIFNNIEQIDIKFNDLCRKFPVGFSKHLISKQLKDETFKKISPFYFFYNSNLRIVYSLADIVNQGIETENGVLYKEGYPLRVFFGMTLLQYIGYLMVAKVVVSKMKEQFIKNPKYDYQGLLENIIALEKNIQEYVGDTEKVNSKNNNRSLQVMNASQSAPNALNPARNASKSAQPASQQGGQEANVINSSTAIKYMQKNEKIYFDKAKQFPKYSTTIKQFLFDTLPTLKGITDRQQKRKEFVKLLHTSLLSTCNIKPDQQTKITDFMKNSFPTGLLEQEWRTPTRGFNEQGQGTLEKLQKLNNTIGSYTINELGYLIVPFIPLSSDGQNQLDKIIEHMKKMGGFYLKKFEDRIFSEKDKITRANEIYKDLSSRTGIYSLSRGTPLLKLMYPSINDSVGIYIVGMIYKILITYTNYNFYYSQTTKCLYFLLIIIYINYGIQYLLDFLKKAYIIFSVIENFSIPSIINRILRHNKKNYSIKSLNDMFFSDKLISTEIEAPYLEKVLNQIKSVFTKKKRYYSTEEKILHIKRYYYYVSYFYNEDVKKYYEKYGLIFLYFSLYIPDLIYYISDNKDYNKNITNIRETEQYKINYAKKIQYLFKLSDNEIKNKSIAVIDEFLPKLINYIKTINSRDYDLIGKSNINLNIDKLYKKIMNNLSLSNKDQHDVSNDEYSANNSTNTLKKEFFEKNYNKLIELITEPVHFESNEKAIAKISGIPSKFDESLVSPHYFAFNFNLDKIKEVCSKGLMKFSKKNCIQFIKADVKNIMIFVKELFHTETNIWKYFVEIQIRLIKEEIVFASQEVKTLIYISRLFGSNFDSILEVFYQFFPYFMFCFEYISIISHEICNILINPCSIIHELDIGLEKIIILYKYLNITNIEIMEYVKKYGIIFLIYALLTPFYICQTELNGKKNTLNKQIIIDKLKAMEKYELVKQVKSVFDDRKILEFIKKVEEKKNKIFGKVPVAPNNSNSNLNINNFSNNGNTYKGNKRPDLPNMDKKEPNGQNAEFIWSVFTIPVQ
jgi:hypothetical protein